LTAEPVAVRTAVGPAVAVAGVAVDRSTAGVAALAVLGTAVVAVDWSTASCSSKMLLFCSGFDRSKPRFCVASDRSVAPFAVVAVERSTAVLGAVDRSTADGSFGFKWFKDAFDRSKAWSCVAAFDRAVVFAAADAVVAVDRSTAWHGTDGAVNRLTVSSLAVFDRSKASVVDWLTTEFLRWSASAAVVGVAVDRSTASCSSKMVLFRRNGVCSGSDRSEPWFGAGGFGFGCFGEPSPNPEGKLPSKCQLQQLSDAE